MMCIVIVDASLYLTSFTELHKKKKPLFERNNFLDRLCYCIQAKFIEGHTIHCDVQMAFISQVIFIMICRV